MKRSRNEVGRWRMQRQTQRRRGRWLMGQSRRYRHIYACRYQLEKKQRRSMLFINQFW